MDLQRMPRPDEAMSEATRLRAKGVREPVDLSVVAPLFEEGEIVAELVERLSKTLDEMEIAWEVVLVDDGSTDDTWKEIRRARARDRRIKGISLSRNFGHQTAITAGLEHAEGASVVVMDGDLQDAPEAIPQLREALRDGCDVVYAIRSRRPEPFWKKTGYHLFYRLLQRSSEIGVPLDAGDFGIMSRRVVDLINAMPERKRFVRGLRAWVGFRQVGVPIDRQPRAGGRPKYDAGKLIGLALDGLVGFSEAPLRIAGVLGLAAIAGSFFLATVLIARAFAFHREMPAGWSIALAFALFFGGAQLLCAAVLGEYVCRVFHQSNGRPKYVVGESLGVKRSRKSSKKRPIRQTAQDYSSSFTNHHC